MTSHESIFADLCDKDNQNLLTDAFSEMRADSADLTDVTFKKDFIKVFKQYGVPPGMQLALRELIIMTVCAAKITFLRMTVSMSKKEEKIFNRLAKKVLVSRTV